MKDSEFRIPGSRTPTLGLLFVAASFLLTGCIRQYFDDGFLVPSPAPPPTPHVATPAPYPNGSTVPPGSFPKKFIPHYPEDEAVLEKVMPGWTESKNAKNPGGNPQDGKSDYESNCAFCHGNDGKGDGPSGDILPTRPRNFTEGIFLYGKEDWQLYRTITYGIPNSGMQPLGEKGSSAGTLDEKTVWGIVNYIKTFIPNK